MGVREPWSLIAMSAAIVTLIGITYHDYRHPPPGLRLPWLHLAGSFVALMSGTYVMGPFILLPTTVIASGTSYLAAFDGRRTLATMAAMVGSVMVPFALQLAGVLPASYRFDHGEVTLLPGMTELPRVPTIVFLIVTHTVMICAALMFVRALRKTAMDAERRLQTQAWQLAQIVPDDARALIGSAK